MASARFIGRRVVLESIQQMEYKNVSDSDVNVTDVTYVRVGMDSENIITPHLLRTIMILSAYVGIFFLGILPNTLLIYLIFTRKFMRVKYIFTVSISIAQVMMCIGAIPLVIVYHVTHDAAVTCACHVIVCYSVGVASYCMLAIAIRRCLALSERFRQANFTYRGKVKNILSIWIVSLAISLPYIWCFDNSPYNLIGSAIPTSEDNQSTDNGTNLHLSFKGNSNNSEFDEGKLYELGHFVEPLQTNHSSKDTGAFSTLQSKLWVYSVVMVMLQILLPICVSLALQINIYKGLRRRPNQIHWVKEIQITKQHAIMAVVFIICWFPLVCFNLISNHMAVRTSDIRMMLELVAASSVIYNPVIYFLLNAHIRRELHQWINSILRRRRNEI